MYIKRRADGKTRGKGSSESRSGSFYIGREGKKDVVFLDVSNKMIVLGVRRRRCAWCELGRAMLKRDASADSILLVARDFVTLALRAVPLEEPKPGARLEMSRKRCAEFTVERMHPAGDRLYAPI